MRISPFVRPREKCSRKVLDLPSIRQKSSICCVNLSTGPDSLHPLSYGQKSLWFVYQLAPDSVAYNVAYAARIAAEVNVPALRDCISGGDGSPPLSPYYLHGYRW